MMNPNFLVKILDNHLISVNKVPALRLTFIRGLNAAMVLQFELHLLKWFFNMVCFFEDLYCNLQNKGALYLENNH